MLAHFAIPSSTTYFKLHILDWRFNGPFQLPFIMPLNLLATNVSPQCVSGSSPNGGINHLPNRQLHRQQQQQWIGPGKIETTKPLDSQRNALINARDPKNKVWPKMVKDQPTKVTKLAARESQMNSRVLWCCSGVDGGTVSLARNISASSFGATTKINLIHIDQTVSPRADSCESESHFIKPQARSICCKNNKTKNANAKQHKI